MNIIRLVLNSQELKARFGPICPDCGTRCARDEEASAAEADVAIDKCIVECPVCGTEVLFEPCDEVAVYDDDRDDATSVHESPPPPPPPPQPLQPQPQPPQPPSQVACEEAPGSPSLWWNTATTPAFSKHGTLCNGRNGRGGRGGRDRHNKAKRAGLRAGHLAPMRDCPEFTRADTEERTYKLQKRINGTVPRLVEMNAHRRKLVSDIRKKCGAAMAVGGAEVTPAEFQALLLEAGYSEGSVDPTNPEKCRKDGCVYKYPAYMAEFFAAGVVRLRADFFESATKQRALEFAAVYGERKATASPKYASLSKEGQARLRNKHAMNLMHGFSVYVKLASAASSCEA